MTFKGKIFLLLHVQGRSAVKSLHIKDFRYEFFFFYIYLITYVNDFYLGIKESILVVNPAAIRHTVTWVCPIATVFSALVFI